MSQNRQYELVYIVSPDASEQAVADLHTQVEQIVQRFNGTQTTIPGYSKFVANLTAFYERNGFNLRGSMRHRSGFLGEFPSFNGAPEQQYVLGETVYDETVQSNLGRLRSVYTP